MKVPYVNLSAQHVQLKEELLAAVGRVLDHGQFILGDEVTQFEERFSKTVGVFHSVGVNSGTDALVLALKALGIGPCDEVITPPNSFVASAGCIALVGARPVFVDVLEDYNINPALIEQAITPQTKAIIPVHLTGRSADMGPIMEVARKHGLHVIEDCAQAVTAEYKGQRVGSIGDVGCFSLHPLKTLNACGDGGVLTTKDAALAQEFKVLRNLGLKERDDCVTWGHNSRLDTMQAAMLLVKLDYLDRWTEKRQSNAHYYQELLSGISQVQCPVDQEHDRAVYHTFVIQADRRDELKAHLAEKGVATAIHYPVPIHLHKAAEHLGYSNGDFPVSERQAGRIISLPIYPELRAEQLEYVAASVCEFYK